MTFTPAPGETAWQIITSACVGNPDTGYNFEYYGGLYYRPRDEAWQAGCRETGSDDFNIGEIHDGRLARMWWCDEVIEETPEDLAVIAEMLGYTPRGASCS